MDAGNSVEVPFLGSNTQQKWNRRSVAVLSFFGGVVATACIMAACIMAVAPSSDNVKDSAISMYMEEKWCQKEDFRNVAMKTAVDATIFGLVRDINMETKFEAS